VFKIFDKQGEMSARMAFVKFLYHQTPLPQPRRAPCPDPKLEALLDAYFTANRQFKSKPRLLSKASGMHYWTLHARKSSTPSPDSVRKRGHGRRENHGSGFEPARDRLDYAPPFRWGIRQRLSCANRWSKSRRRDSIMCSSRTRSESVDTALRSLLA